MKSGGTGGATASQGIGAGPTNRSRTSLLDRAYREIKTRILDNRYPAGFQALEQELAERLTMSRTPVREALIRLAKEGLVEVRPRHGMRVLPVSVTDIREIYEVLTALESEAAGMAARRGLTPGQMRLLQNAVDQMDRALARNNRRAWARADEKFHTWLVAFGGNRRLQLLVDQCWEQSHRVRMSTLRLRPPPVTSNEDHRMVVEAIAAGDARKATRIHRRHREKAAKMLVRILTEAGVDEI